MHTISPYQGSGLVIATSASTLPNPPTSAQYGLVPDEWLTLPEVDLELWAVAAATITAAELYAAILHPLVYADNAITTVTNATDTFTKVAHALITGDGPIQFTTTGVLPAGMSLLTDYYVVRTDADNFKIATSRALAYAGTVVNLTGDGTGTHTVVDVASTARMYWHAVGLLGNAGDGAITLGAQRAYCKRLNHRPGVIAYALVATTSSAVTCRLMPVVDRN